MTDLMSLQEASQKLNISPHTLRHWAQAGSFPYVRAGRLLRFRQEDLDQFVKRNLIKERKAGSR